MDVEQGGGIDVDSIFLREELSHFHFVFLLDSLNGALEPGVLRQFFQLLQLLQMSDPLLADMLQQQQQILLSKSISMSIGNVKLPRR